MIVRHGRGADCSVLLWSVRLFACLGIAYCIGTGSAQAALSSPPSETQAVVTPQTNTEMALLAEPVTQNTTASTDGNRLPDAPNPEAKNTDIARATPKQASTVTPLTEEDEEAQWFRRLPSAEPIQSVAWQPKPVVAKPLDGLPDAYMLSQTRSGTVHVLAKPSEDKKTASLYVNQQEILRFRAGYKQLDPHQRAKQAAHRLQAYLKNQGDYQQIGVHNQAGLTVIRLGSAPFVVVDPKTAQLAGVPPAKLAASWSHQLRRTLGEPEAPTVANLLPNLTREAGKLIAIGHASWYGPGFHGRRAADGSRFNQNAMTAAHKTLPFGTIVKVTNKANGRSCLVRITDRGPFIAGRVIDLSAAAARALNMMGSGVARVSIELLK